MSHWTLNKKKNYNKTQSKTFFTSRRSDYEDSILGTATWPKLLWWLNLLGGMLKQKIDNTLSPLFLHSWKCLIAYMFGNCGCFWYAGTWGRGRNRRAFGSWRLFPEQSRALKLCFKPTSQNKRRSPIAPQGLSNHQHLHHLLKSSTENSP